MTKQILAQAGFRRRGMVQSLAEALQLWERLGPPLVIKPGDGNQGKGQSESANPAPGTSISNGQKLQRAGIGGKTLARRSLPLAGGKRLHGRGCQALAGPGVGDGDILFGIDRHHKRDPLGRWSQLPLTKIKIDPIVLMVLEAKPVLDDVPDPKVVFLRITLI